MSIIRVLRRGALALALVVPGVVVASGPAQAAVTASCVSNWTEEGGANEVYAHDELGRLLPVGVVFQQYDYCGSVRGVFEWESSFRTQAHEGISGAWATVYDVATYGGDYTYSARTGSGASAVIITGTLPVHAGGTDDWFGKVKVDLTYTTGGSDSCTATGATWDYHNGGQVANGAGCTLIFY